MIEYFQPGHVVYMQVEAVAPDALPMFTVWVAAEQAATIAYTHLIAARDRAGAQAKRDDDLIREWRGMADVQTSLGTSASMAMNILAERLRSAQIDNPYGWAQEKLTALKNEASRAQNAA